MIENYHNEVISCIQTIYYYEGTQISNNYKLNFFTKTSQGYGKTALFLSGGGSNGKYHFGVLKALYEQDLLPRIICGSSAGAIMGSYICSHKYQDLKQVFEGDYKKFLEVKIIKKNFKTMIEALKLILK